jgi:hypothetical protein
MTTKTITATDVLKSMEAIIAHHDALEPDQKTDNLAYALVDLEDQVMLLRKALEHA